MKFFSLENPIWKFIGNLADFFLLSCLWYLCCLPVVTAGAATTALYYVTLKMARGQEGQLIPAFFHSFKQNLKQATALWVGYLAVGILLVLDLVICLQTSSVFAGAMFFTSVVLLACWALMPALGFFASIFLMLMAISLIMAEGWTARTVGRQAALNLAFTACLYVVFVVLLQMVTPSGLII